MQAYACRPDTFFFSEISESPFPSRIRAQSKTIRSQSRRSA